MGTKRFIFRLLLMNRRASYSTWIYEGTESVLRSLELDTGNYDATEMWFDEELHEMKREGLIEIEENGGRLADDDVDVDFWLTELGENVCRKVLQTFEAGDTAECILKSLKSNHSLRIVYSQWAIGTYGVSSKEDERVVKGALF